MSEFTVRYRQYVVYEVSVEARDQKDANAYVLRALIRGDDDIDGAEVDSGPFEVAGIDYDVEKSDE